RPSDPSAIAGAADVIAVLAAITKGPEPWRPEVDSTNFTMIGMKPDVRARFEAHFTAARSSYAEARNARDPDVLKSPWSVALQFYLEAQELDTSSSLPLLGTRVYLLRYPF